MLNHRPVSNLSFLSEVLEKVVVSQQNSHIVRSNTSNQYRSAYRKFHSTESALPKAHNDIPASIDAGTVTALTLLGLSPALDTIDHTFLLRRLDDWFGVTGNACNCFEWYLTGGLRWMTICPPKFISLLEALSMVSFRSSAFQPLYNFSE